MLPHVHLEHDRRDSIGVNLGSLIEELNGSFIRPHDDGRLQRLLEED